MHIHAGVLAEPKVPDLSELELQVVVNSRTSVVGTELGLLEK